MSKYCPECGVRLEGDPKFCPECGNKFIKEKPKKKMQKETISSLQIFGYIIGILIIIFGLLIFLFCISSDGIYNVELGLSFSIFMIITGIVLCIGIKTVGKMKPLVKGIYITCLITLALITIALFYISAFEPDQDEFGWMKGNIIYTAKEEIKNRMKFPSTTLFENIKVVLYSKNTNYNDYLITGECISENEIGQMCRSNFYIHLECHLNNIYYVGSWNID